MNRIPYLKSLAFEHIEKNVVVKKVADPGLHIHIYPQKLVTHALEL